jgi:heat shock protein HslJ
MNEDGNMKISKFILIICSLLFLLNACIRSSDVGVVDLEGRTWVLTSYTDIQPVVGHQPTLQFEDGQVSGTTGCNHYGGSYQLEGDSIRFEALFSTEMACLDPDGLMEQEQVYLGLLRAINRFEMNDLELSLFTEAGQDLVFEIQQKNPEEPMVRLDPPTPALSPTFAPPASFKEYQDVEAGVSLYIPEGWVVTGVIPGQYAIFTSYPTDKYVGGEVREPGDTKCDLNIRPEDESTEGVIQQWQSDSMTTIVSEDTFTLQTGLMSQRFVIDSMGRATVFLTEINQRIVLLTCFGDFTPVDAIATTLNTLE